MIRRGFSVLEVTVANCLMVVLAVAVSSSLIHLGRPTIDTLKRLGIQEQATLATTFLRQDLAGQLSEVESGDKEKGREVGRQVIDGSELRLCFDGGDNDGVAQWGSPDRVIRYYQQNGSLVRHDEAKDHFMIVAKYLSQFEVTQDNSLTTIELKFEYRDVEKEFTFVSPKP
jgi:type II secretory pathway component PulJ